MEGGDDARVEEGLDIGRLGGEIVESRKGVVFRQSVMRVEELDQEREGGG